MHAPFNRRSFSEYKSSLHVCNASVEPRLGRESRFVLHGDLDFLCDRHAATLTVLGIFWDLVEVYPPHSIAYRVDEPIVMDGNLDEAAWQAAPTLSPFQGQRS